MITVSLGWWMLPTIFTLAVVGFALFYDPRPTSPIDLTGLFMLVLAVILSLSAWLVWAIFT